MENVTYFEQEQGFFSVASEKSQWPNWASLLLFVVLLLDVLFPLLLLLLICLVLLVDAVVVVVAVWEGFVVVTPIKQSCQTRSESSVAGVDAWTIESGWCWWWGTTDTVTPKSNQIQKTYYSAKKERNQRRSPKLIFGTYFFLAGMADSSHLKTCYSAGLIFYVTTWVWKPEG